MTKKAEPNKAEPKVVEGKATVRRTKTQAELDAEERAAGYPQSREAALRDGVEWFHPRERHLREKHGAVAGSRMFAEGLKKKPSKKSPPKES